MRIRKIYREVYVLMKIPPENVNFEMTFLYGIGEQDRSMRLLVSCG